MKKIFLLIAMALISKFSFAFTITSGCNHYLCQGASTNVVASPALTGYAWSSTSSMITVNSATGAITSSTVSTPPASRIITSSAITYAPTAGHTGPSYYYTIFLVYNGPVTITPTTSPDHIPACGSKTYTASPALGNWTGSTNLAISGNSNSVTVRAKVAGTVSASETLTYTYDTYTCGTVPTSKTIILDDYPSVSVYATDFNYNVSSTHFPYITVDAANYNSSCYWTHDCIGCDIRGDRIVFPAGTNYTRTIEVEPASHNYAGTGYVHYHFFPFPATNPGCGKIYSTNVTVTGHRDAYDDPQNTFGQSTGQFKLYPNPTNGIFKINLPNTAEGKNIIITDINGKVAHTKNTTEQTADFDLSSFPKGTYIVNVYAGEEKHQEKVVVE